MNFLLTGGAGYIGSHMVLFLQDRGHQVTILDNLSTGAPGDIAGTRLVRGNVGDAALLDDVFGSQRFDGVLHFASLIEVGESVRRPGDYYRNNVLATITLLDAMVRHDVQYLVFSSSAAVYGIPEYSPIDERHLKAPINPYGASKWMVEQILEHYGTAHGLQSVSLRYFNAAGADPDGRIGSRRCRESHLIPKVLNAASGGEPVRVFGNDYPTADGTCIRDYVHVSDLCGAHLLAFAKLVERTAASAYNLGNGRGFSVREVLQAAERVTGQKIPTVTAPRRAGDPPGLVADATLAQRDLGWLPRYTDIETILEHAWGWHCKRHQIGAMAA